MKNLFETFSQHKIDHNNRMNVLAHYYGIPALLCGILIFLNWFTFSFALNWHITFSWILVALMLIAYFRIHHTLALWMTGALFLLNSICFLIAYPQPTVFNILLCTLLLAGGISLQIMGGTLHKSLRSCSNCTFLLVGPLFMLNRLLAIFNLDITMDSQSKDSESQ